MVSRNAAADVVGRAVTHVLGQRDQGVADVIDVDEVAGAIEDSADLQHARHGRIRCAHSSKLRGKAGERERMLLGRTDDVEMRLSTSVTPRWANARAAIDCEALRYAVRRQRVRQPGLRRGASRPQPPRRDLAAEPATTYSAPPRAARGRRRAGARLRRRCCGTARPNRCRGSRQRDGTLDVRAHRFEQSDGLPAPREGSGRHGVRRVACATRRACHARCRANVRRAQSARRAACRDPPRPPPATRTTAVQPSSKKKRLRSTSIWRCASS